MIIDTDGNHLEDQPYTNEDEFQHHIFNHPELLSASDDDKYIAIAREVTTNAGRIDVLMLSKTGNIVVVEVKLDRNQQSRREIVAQIVDYVSTLSELSVYELNDKTHGKLLSKLEDTDYDAQTVDKLLRNGNIEVVLAVDQTNESLNRIVQFLAAHTDFKISLVEISKHRDNERTLLSSSIIFSQEEQPDDLDHASGQSQGNLTRAQTMTRIAEAWNESDFAKQQQLFTKGSNAATFRQIIVPGWKSTLHYEFTYVRGSIYVRLDNELNPNDPNKSAIREIFQSFNGQSIQNRTVVARYNQLCIAHFKPNDLTHIIAAMNELINLTRATIDREISFSKRAWTTFAMLNIPIGSQLRCIKYPDIVATTADDKNQIIDMKGQKRSISNYSNELLGYPTSGFEHFSYNGTSLIDIRNTNEQTNGE